MGNQWGLGLHFIFVTIFMVATTYTCSGDRNTTAACLEHERLALLRFKHSVTKDYGMLSSWVGDDCCRWKGVMCDGVTGNVESLHLRGVRDFNGDIYLSNSLSREGLVCKVISISLGELGRLKLLDLSGNDFQGSKIPEFIGSLKRLTYLNLSNAHFSGIIPHHIGNLSNLKNLDLYSLDQRLAAQDMAWISGLSSLEYLDLTSVHLSGAKNLDMVLYTIPSLKVLRLINCDLSDVDLRLLHNLSTKLSNLIHLDIGYNYFKGELPLFFHNMTSLQFLDLSAFSLNLTSKFAALLSMFPSLSVIHLSSCNIKETYLFHILHNSSSLSNIQDLGLSYNKLKGPVLESLSKLKLLQVFDLSCNNLTGPIPTLPAKLTKLDLSYNYFSGSIPESLSKLKLLQHLIPDSFGTLDALTTLRLQSNRLSGIPTSIGQLYKLSFLDVSHNSLEGIVSECHFANLSKLEYLFASDNSKLTFNISREWMPPFQLIQTDLSTCKIENGFPQWLQYQSKLIVLDLSNASISGPLPTWWRKMPIIPTINLSRNNFSGPLANLPIGRDTYLDGSSELHLQDNMFSGSIPRSLCKRTDLYLLDLSSNSLSGKIPKCFKNMKNLIFMRLSSNELSGVIPSFIGHMSELSSLNLNDNNFSGELPIELWNLTRLNILDLGDNAFYGNIPEWIGEKVKDLLVFRLHNNYFTGGIPRSLCTNLDLQVLDVAHNNFTGTIPHCLGNLQNMVKNRGSALSYGSKSEEVLIQVLKGVSLEYTTTWSLVNNMDLSSNNLNGEIPGELTALSALVGLNLSNNHLSGGIPDNIGNMSGLNSLDLSGNELSGQIPPSIALLNFLSYLNLSNNNLSGRIPTGNQLQTLIDPSIYVGNKDLCGAPLPKNCSNHKDPNVTAKSIYEEVDKPNKVWFYMDITCGFATGFWGVILVLVLKKQWRHKLFMFGEEAINKIHVAVMVRVNKMKRGREAI